MTFGEKLLQLRKQEGLTQEALAEQLNVSRQAISRWEKEGILPDAENLLQISRLFGVTTDYLLYDEWTQEIPGRREAPVPSEAALESHRWRNQQVGFVISVTLLGLGALLQLTSWFVLQNLVFVLAGLGVQLVAVAGFEIGWRRAGERVLPSAHALRRKYYTALIWLISYTPIRIVCNMAWGIWPKPYSSLHKEVSIVAVYGIVSLVVTIIWRLLSKPSQKI